MKTWQEIEKEISQEVISRSEKVTFIGVKGSLRGFITAVSLKLRELWFELGQTVRKLFYETAEGKDLDILVGQIGLSRRGSSPAGVLLLLNGTSGTIIPAGTSIRDEITNIEFLTKQSITLGGKNPDFVISGEINIKSEIIGDICWAECSIPGTSGNVQANTLNNISISGVEVTNPAPATGGSSGETDDELRFRARNYIKILNRNTQAFYEAISIYIDERLLRARAVKDFSEPDAVQIILVSKNAVPFTQPELKILSSKIYESQKTFTKITSVNIGFTYISVEMRVKLKPDNNGLIDFGKYYQEMADVLSDFFDWSKWEWGKKISLDDAFLLATSVQQTDDIELSTFKLNGSNATSILIASNSLPYFQSLKITNITDDTATTLENSNIVQSYQNVTLSQEEI